MDSKALFNLNCSDCFLLSHDDCYLEFEKNMGCFCNKIPVILNDSQMEKINFDLKLAEKKWYQEE